MSELRDVGRMLEAAEQAAVADDLASADELLRSAARIQEAELGPLHPDLANTLNNLAVVAEKTGRLDDAETFYRRAVAIASASLPPGHPMIAASRQNLEDFCRARGVPIDTPGVATPAVVDAVAAAPAGTDAAEAAPAGTDVAAADSALAMEATPPSSESPRPVPGPRTRTASAPHPAAPRGDSRWLATAAIGVVVVLVTATVLVRRPWSSHEASTAAPTAERTTPAQAGARALPTREPAPIEQAQPPATGLQSGDRGAPAGKPAPSRSSGAITLTTAQLCRTFSTSGDTWQCDPAVDPVSPGRIVLYTRVRSPRDAVIVHRWYRGDTLRQSVNLTIRSTSEGYRTYSRQTVDGGADWHVEVRSADGALLHERRFVVR
jgi:Tetratricopeptide repeat/Protein of unknown function (DUF2914)